MFIGRYGLIYKQDGGEHWVAKYGLIYEESAGGGGGLSIPIAAYHYNHNTGSKL